MKAGLLALMGTVLILSALFFSTRNVILKNILDDKIRTYQENHKLDVLSIGAAKFSGLDRIIFENIRLQANAKTLVINLKSCSLKLAFARMLVGQVKPKKLQIDDLRINFYQDSMPGHDFTSPAGKTDAYKKISRTPAYSAEAGYWLDLFFKRIPDSLKINRLTVNSNINHIRQTFYIPQLAVNDLDFVTLVQIENKEKKWAWYLAGNIDRRKKQLAFRLLPLRPEEKINLPFIDQQWDMRVSLNFAEISLKSNGLHDGTLQLLGSLAVNGLTLNHPRIAVEDVNVQNAALDYVLNIGADYFELDHSTRVRFNKVSFHPYFKFKTWPTRQLTLKLGKTKFKADDLFSSLPAGLFSKLAGIKTSGELTYEFSFFIDFNSPELLSLESDLENNNFKIDHFGRVDFTAINAPFLYTAYEKDQALRSFMIGPENPDFRSLDQLPPFLKNAVLISEDGAFFGHKGFLLGPFKESIAANIKEKRFVRGASTISMQLVKNLYLKRQKTIARKLEEMIITWLIEEKRLVAKERMYEIYLNIIEWGPLVYGAAEAARFYFDKEVAKLTLAEAIFMASIIPRPKRFMFSFDKDQRLRPWLQAYYDDVSYKMLKREMISLQDYDQLVPDVRLEGPARFLLKGNESMPADQLWQPDETEE